MDPKDKKLLTTFLIALGVALVFLYLARRVMTPFFIAFALAYLLDPLVDKMGKCKLSRTPAVILLLTIFFLVVSAGTAVLVPLFRVQMEHLAANLPVYLQTLQDWGRPLIENGNEKDGRASRSASWKPDGISVVLSFQFVQRDPGCSQHIHHSRRHVLSATRLRLYQRQNREYGSAAYPCTVHRHLQGN
jgi:hypothetical protein